MNSMNRTNCANGANRTNCAGLGWRLGQADINYGPLAAFLKNWQCKFQAPQIPEAHDELCNSGRPWEQNRAGRC